MSHYYAIPLVDDIELARTLRYLGDGFSRILGYFHDDGMQAIVHIEQAMEAGDAAAMVLPAHRLKAEARLLNAIRLSDIAEEIEKTARSCVEGHQEPSAVAVEIAMLRGCFTETLTVLDTVAEHTANVPHHNPRQPANAPQARHFGRRLAS